MDLNVTLTIPRLAALDASIARRILTQEVGQGVTRIVEAVATQARADAPVDRGILRGSIFTRVTPGVGPVLVEGLVATGRQAPYAEDVERGTPPHWITDIDALKGWARRKLGNENRAYAVRHSIAKRGTLPQPYLMPAAEAIEPQVPGIMNAAVAVAVRRLGQP